MTREQVLKELNEIFIANFDDDEIVLNDETTSADIEYWDSLEQINIILACEKKWNLKFDIEEWDSLEHINLIMAVGAEFAIKFKMGEVSAMKNVGEMVDLIYRKVG